MKILQLVQKPQFRGAEIFTSQLAQQLSHQGHKVILVYLFPGLDYLPFEGTQVSLNRNLKMRIIDFKGWSALNKIIQDFQPDIIQANAADTLKYAVISKKLFGWKAPIVFRNASTISQYIHSSFVKAFNHCLLRQVDGIVSVSKHSQDDLIKLFPSLKAKKEVIPIAVLQTMARNAGPSNKQVFVHVGGFTFEKDHEGLMKIFCELVKIDSNSELWLFGDGPLMSHIEKLVENLGLKDQVKFKGIVANPWKSIPTNSVLLMPSKIEGLPAVILEAMYVRVPVVAYDVGGIGEVVKNGETGWLVPKGDKKAFIKSIQEILNSDRENIKKITTQARELVLQQYTLEKVAGEFEKVYREVINQSFNP